MDASIFGLIVADIVVQPMDLRAPPAPGGLQMVNSITLTTGGNVCNTGIAMSKLGMNVAAAGLVGDDILGRAVIDRLEQFHVDTGAVFKTKEVGTCSTIVAVPPDGRQSYYHVPGATKLLDADACRKCFPTFARSQWVQVGYFGLLPTLTPHLPQVLAELRKITPRTKIALDTIPPPEKWSLLEPILPHLDLLAPSRTEAETLTGQNDPREMVKVFRKHMRPGSLIGVKLDKEGCLLDDGEKSLIVPPYSITVVDTTGAGDTWFAGLLTGLIKGMPLEKAGKLANRAAADCCTALGASTGVKSFDETVARI